MNKKIIAVLIVLTVLFMTVFAACNKDDEEKIYVSNDEYDFVTDENGERVLNEDGEFLIYAQNDKGKREKNENGEYVTIAQPFEAVEDGDYIEDYGYKFTLPDGWKVGNKKGEFINEKAKQAVEITLPKYTYSDYYDQNMDMYQKLKGLGETVTWEDDIDLGEDFAAACRFTLKTEEGMSVLYFFVNSGNVYKVLFTSEDPATAIADSEAFCKVINFKPFTYYDDVTSKETTAAVSTTAAELTTAQ